MVNFDRTAHQLDLPKLEGCFTRGAQYRWNVFQPYLRGLPGGAEVLDVGCGSLKETHYLATRGFRVTGIDLNARRMEEFRQHYDWSNVPAPILRVLPIGQLAAEGHRFDAITAFDVIEHLDNLEENLDALLRLLKPGGLMFISTPNGRSLTEIYGWLMLRAMRAVGHKLEPGVPHLQTHTPHGWRKRFEQAGFEVRDWEMTIGPVANSCTLLCTAPLQIALMGLQVLRIISREQRHKLLAMIASKFSGTWLPKSLKAVDDHTRALTKPFFTWNLVVLRAPDAPRSPAA